MLFRKKKRGPKILEKSLFPINETEKIIPGLARSFPAAEKHKLEVCGYLIGLNQDLLTHLVIPEYIMGGCIFILDMNLRR